MIQNFFLQFGRTFVLLLTLASLFIFVSCTPNTNKRSFTFIYNVELEPSNGKKIELWLPVPQSNEVQKISKLNIKCEDLSYEIKDEQKHNNKYVYIYSNDGISKNTMVTMTFNVERYEHQNINCPAVDPSKYLGASALVPTGKIFNSIIQENKLNNNDLKGLYDFVLSGMHYGKPESKDNQYYKEPWLSSKDTYGLKKVSRDKVVELYKKAKATDGSYTFGNGNSLYACDIGVGNCTDYHSYFISLSRTMEIPARFHMGFSIPDEKEGKVEGYHCWADYYVEGGGWYPVDISEADKDPEKIDYFFGNIFYNRVEMIVGRDFKLEGYEEETINLFIYPLLEIDDIKSDSFKKSFSYKNL